jgi:hypothetical protein
MSRTIPPFTIYVFMAFKGTNLRLGLLLILMFGEFEYEHVKQFYNPIRLIDT